MRTMAETQTGGNEGTHITLYRQKVIYSCCLCMSFFAYGLNRVEIESALQGLQQITSVSLSEASVYLTIYNVGFMAGSFVCGVVYNYIDKFIAQFIIMSLVAIVVAVTPWCHVYVVMVTAHFVEGFLYGVIAPVTTAELLAVWGTEARRFMQALHLCCAIGKIVAPVITAQFISNIEHTQPGDNNLTDSRNQKLVDIGNYGTSHVMDGAVFNSGNYINESESVKYDMLPGSDHSLTDNGRMLNVTPPNDIDTSRLFIPYAIESCICGCIGTTFLIMYFKFDVSAVRSGRQTHDRVTMTSTCTGLSKYLVMINFGVMSFVYCGHFEIVGGLLSSFCTRRLHWSVMDGTYVLTVLFVCVLLGRLLAVIGSKYVSPSQALGILCTIVVCSTVGMLMCAGYYINIGVWIMTGCVGVGVSAIFPTLLIWIEEDFFPVSGKITSYLGVSLALGGGVSPVVTGSLMDVYSTMWFIYLLLVESVILFVAYICGVLLSRRCKTNTCDQEHDETRLVLEQTLQNQETIKSYANLLRDFQRASPVSNPSTR